MDRTAWRPWIVPTALVAVTGVVLVAFADGVAATIGAGLLGIAGVLVLAAFFYSVGRAEDRDLERERERRRRP